MEEEDELAAVQLLQLAPQFGPLLLQLAPQSEIQFLQLAPQSESLLLQLSPQDHLLNQAQVQQMSPGDGGDAVAENWRCWNYRRTAAWPTRSPGKNLSPRSCRHSLSNLLSHRTEKT